MVEAMKPQWHRRLYSCWICCLDTAQLSRSCRSGCASDLLIAVRIFCGFFFTIRVHVGSEAPASGANCLQFLVIKCSDCSTALTHDFSAGAALFNRSASCGFACCTTLVNSRALACVMIMKGA